MSVPSLVHLARKACMKIIKRIDDIGLARYDLIRPILQKIENPEHLRELELKSPHLLEHDAELWMEFIKRDVPGYDKLILPENPESWYDVYHELLEKTAMEVDKDAERMKRALLGLDSKKARHSSKVVDTQKMRLPKEKPTAIQRYAFLDRKMGGIAPVFVPAAPKEGGRGITPYDQTPRWKFETPKIPRSAPAPKKSALPLVKRNHRLCIPTHRLNSSASQVVNAPRSLIEAYKRPIEQSIPRPTTRDLRSSSSTTPTITTQSTTTTTKTTNLSLRPSPRDPGSNQSKTLVPSSASPTTPSRPSPIRRHNSLPTRREEQASMFSTTSPTTTKTTDTHQAGDDSHTSAAKPPPPPSSPPLPRPAVRKRPVAEYVLVKPKKRRLF
ncbi:RNA polymerase II transcription factor SIII subunit A [Blastomyces gilchristii SLH14081]|uniref:RNA polymerase II transcription factor SIII subunit A n=1 Tax=Blastomyces gilchristii (strain SLH14081) TaxID=559298 RepID=A0A179UXM5_BLAGS|nr:RNA polymerase II transcription factor SIII subunit A [Blastomyces gilchristii SLH14081]OAT12855.1 RNA polymerase II transcription factor SIII subunit A [Blastomyces gilchristii SLH14081]